MSQDTKDSKEIPFVPAIVALGDGHQIKVDGRGIIISSTNKELVGKRHCESLPYPDFIAHDEYEYDFDAIEEFLYYIQRPAHSKIKPEDIQGLINKLKELKTKIEKRREEVRK